MMASLRWWPRTLVGRVFALYAVTLALFVLGGTTLFLRHQYGTSIAAATDDARTLFSVLVPVVTEAAVIGDYDSIQRQLARAARHSGVAEIRFTDARGTRLQGLAPESDGTAPSWLSANVAARLPGQDQPIEAGGTGYGHLMLRFAPGDIARDLWREGLLALALAGAALVGGMLVIRQPLVRWLGDLDRIGDLDVSLRGGQALAQRALAGDAPLEFRRTFEVLDRAAANLQAEREQAQAARDAVLANLRQALERSALPEGTRAAADDDLEAVSQLASRLVARLQERTAQLDAIFALSPDGFVSFDDEGVVRYTSPGFSRLTGLSSETVAGLASEVLLYRLHMRCNGEVPQTLAQVRERAAQDPDGSGGVRLNLREPRTRVLALSLQEGGSGPVSQVLHLRDITHESEVDRMKSEFLTMAAHELRTPMSSIYGFVELMIAREFTPERRRDVLATIHRQCKVMMDLVNELLDLARIEARRDQDFRFEVLSLPEAAAEAAAAFLPPGGREAVQIEPVPGQWPVRVDADKFKRVVGNLLSNAYKYSPQGGPVHLRVVTPPSQAASDTPRVGLQIEDHGIGMTPEQLQRVGERFYRADASGNIPGTGLGMRLVQEIMALMGGQVVLTSRPGEGTVVTLWFPLSEAAVAA